MQKINVKTQKIDGTTLKTYKIVVSNFSILNKDGIERLLKESFLLDDVYQDIKLRIFFLILNNVDIDFQA